MKSLVGIRLADEPPMEGGLLDGEQQVCDGSRLLFHQRDDFFGGHRLGLLAAVGDGRQ